MLQQIDRPAAFDETGVQFAWDSTSLKLAETCLRKYQYKMILGWQPARKSVHLLFGGWYAAALESYYKYVADGTSPEDALAEVVHEALQETWIYEEADGEPIPGTGGPWVSDHNTKTRENLIRTIVWYLDEFGEDDSCTTIVLANGAPMVEHSFRFEVDNDIILCGHLDRGVEYAHHLYVQDQKTTQSTVSGMYFDGYNPDSQMSLYTWAGQIIFGSPVKGVMIDAAQIAVGFTRFTRGFTFRDKGSLEEWYDESLYHIQLAQQATRDNYFPKNPSSCNNYGGCEFRGICSKDPNVRKNFLAGDFTQGKRWDPLEPR